MQICPVWSSHRDRSRMGRERAHGRRRHHRKGHAVEASERFIPTVR